MQCRYRWGPYWQRERWSHASLLPTWTMPASPMQLWSHCGTATTLPSFHARCTGICLEVLRSFPDVPILGVCLGHQALAHVHGGRVAKAPEPVHGRLSELRHSGHALMAGIPSGAGKGFEVVR